ncbi:MAG TPA: NAD(P)-dependent oxidoreductase [Chloroflexota bacterium]|nr:NAD(P)-dependent oxidoreductase [Chloroflexota bacterium]
MNLGFIGLGTMGASMAANLQRGGHQLVVSDIRREAAEPHLAAGAVWADTPQEVARQTEAVFTSLPGPAEVEQVALGEQGLLAGMASGKAWFDLSTNSPTVMRRIAAAFAARGVFALDSPVSGGPEGARTGQLALWVGGDAATFERFKPALGAIGDEAILVGPVGAGCVAKLVHNLASYAVQTALAEAFTLGVKAGVDALPLWKAVRQGAQGRKRTFDRLADQFLPNRYKPPAITLKLAHKDMTLITELAREQHVPLHIGNRVLDEMTEALNRSMGGLDCRAAMLLQQERSGVHIEVERALLERELAG